MYDVVIVGAGSAGIPCAIRAAERGLKVLVLEKDKKPGGTLHVTAGHLSAGGTKRQKEKGIDDSPQEHWLDVQRISRHTADEVVAKKAVELAPATIDWLQQCGYTFHEKAPLLIYGHETYDKPRTYFGAHDYFGGPIAQPGKAVLKTLLPLFEKLVLKGKIELLTQHSLKKINAAAGRVISLEASTDDSTKIFTATHYVLTTGGYAANASFFAAQHPGKNLISTAKETSLGDGIQLAIDIGAVFHNADKHISTLGGIETEPGSGRVNFWAAWARVSNGHDRKPREIYINEQGLRFMNECDLTVDERERLVLQQTNQRFFVMFDEKALYAGTPVVAQWDAEQFKKEATKEKCCWAANSIEALAEKIKVPKDNLRDTLHAYNYSVHSKRDETFRRTYLEHKVAEPPFYALLVYASSLISFGGIKVNGKLQVVHESGTAIENLYAAGEILGAGATSGNAFCSGMLLTPAISFGKWLGENLK